MVVGEGGEGIHKDPPESVRIGQDRSGSVRIGQDFRSPCTSPTRVACICHARIELFPEFYTGRPLE